jgi:hypothetical protein
MYLIYDEQVMLGKVMTVVSKLCQFFMPSLILLGLTACASQNHTQMLPIQMAAQQCANQVLAIGYTQVGETNLFGGPYIINDRMEQEGTASARTRQTITLPVASIPADGANKGETWKACMIGKGF